MGHTAPEVKNPTPLAVGYCASDLLEKFCRQAGKGNFLLRE